MKVGDVILSCDKGFLPSAIRFFMKRYAKRIGVESEKVFNHVAVCVDVRGQKRIAEAMAKGVQIIQTPEEYLAHHHDYLIRTWVKPLSEQEKQTFSTSVKKLAYKVTRYEFSNFFNQIGLINRNVWNGKTGVDALDRMYCSEVAAFAMDETRGSFGGVWWVRNPLDIQINNHLKDI